MKNKFSSIKVIKVSHFLSHLGSYAVWHSAISPPGVLPSADDADGHPGSSRGSAATHAPDCPQPYPRFLRHTFLLPGTPTRYAQFITLRTPAGWSLESIMASLCAHMYTLSHLTLQTNLQSHDCKIDPVFLIFAP